MSWVIGQIKSCGTLTSFFDSEYSNDFIPLAIWELRVKVPVKSQIWHILSFEPEAKIVESNCKLLKKSSLHRTPKFINLHWSRYNLCIWYVQPMFSSNPLECSKSWLNDPDHPKPAENLLHWILRLSRCCRVQHRNERIRCSRTRWEILLQFQQNAAVELSVLSESLIVLTMFQLYCLFDLAVRWQSNRLARFLFDYRYPTLQECK